MPSFGSSQLNDDDSTRFGEIMSSKNLFTISSYTDGIRICKNTRSVMTPKMQGSYQLTVPILRPLTLRIPVSAKVAKLT